MAPAVICPVQTIGCDKIDVYKRQEEERKIKMEQLRPVSKLERILFPIIVTIVVCTILPTTAPLVGMLMLGNMFKDCLLYTSICV